MVGKPCRGLTSSALGSQGHLEGACVWLDTELSCDLGSRLYPERLYIALAGLFLECSEVWGVQVGTETHWWGKVRFSIEKGSCGGGPDYGWLPNCWKLPASAPALQGSTLFRKPTIQVCGYLGKKAILKHTAAHKSAYLNCLLTELPYCTYRYFGITTALLLCLIFIT